MSFPCCLKTDGALVEDGREDVSQRWSQGDDDDVGLPTIQMMVLWDGGCCETEGPLLLFDSLPVVTNVEGFSCS